MFLHMISTNDRRMDGTNFKDFINTRVVTAFHVRIHIKRKMYISENADALLKSFGDEWVDWWRTQR